MFPVLPAIETSSEEIRNQDAAALYRSALKMVAGRRGDSWSPTGLSLQGRWKPTSRRYFWRLDRSKPAIDRFREAARSGGVVYSNAVSERRFSREATLQSFAWMIRLIELHARRMMSARRADWAAELLFDGIRATRDLRIDANQDQLKLAVESELHLMRELRMLTSHRRVTPELAERMFDTASELLSPSDDRADFWKRSYSDQTESHFCVETSGQLPERQRLRRAMYQALIDRGEKGACRELFRLEGTHVNFVFPDPFAGEHSIPGCEEWKSLIDDSMRAEISGLFQISQRMDARDVAAAATLSHLCLFAYYRRLGFYPESLSNGFQEFDREVPVDAFANSGESMQLRLAGGEKLLGRGVDNRRASVRTKQHQPLVYSVGPDRDDDRGAIAWDGGLFGTGDWIFPLPAHRRPRHPLQFDLRKALVAVTLIGLMLAYITSGPARQRRVIRRIAADGGSVEFRASSSGVFQATLRDWLGDERFGTIHSVDLGTSQRVGSLLQSMIGLHDLHSLSLTSCTVKEGDFIHLRHFPDLHTLYLDSAVVPAKEYGSLGVLRNLDSLSCSDTAIDDKGVTNLPELPSLRTFTLSSTSVTGKSFDRLAKCLPNLTELVLYDTQCTDEAMEQVGKLRRLQYLDVDGTEISNRGLEHLSGLTKLQTLDLQRTRITDPALRSLTKMRDLSELRLNETLINGSGLVHLQALPKLETLTMDGTRLSDREVPLLAKLKSLRSLSIDATQVSPKGMAELAKLNASIMFPQWSGGWYAGSPSGPTVGINSFPNVSGISDTAILKALTRGKVGSPTGDTLNADERASNETVADASSEGTADADASVDSEASENANAASNAKAATSIGERAVRDGGE